MTGLPAYDQSYPGGASRTKAWISTLSEVAYPAWIQIGWARVKHVLSVIGYEQDINHPIPRYLALKQALFEISLPHQISMRRRPDPWQLLSLVNHRCTVAQTGSLANDVIEIGNRFTSLCPLMIEAALFSLFLFLLFLASPIRCIRCELA